MMRSATVRAATCLVALLLVGSIGAAEAPIAFSTSGGEAWTFHKPIDITVVDGHCDQVAITSPSGTIITAPLNGHVRVEIPLAPGDNRIKAQCRRAGDVWGTVAQQDWRARLPNTPKAVIRGTEADGRMVLD